MAHIVFVNPKKDIKREEVTRVIAAISKGYCSFDTNCWCLTGGGDSIEIRDALKRTNIFDKIAVFALTGYWASTGLGANATKWLKDYIEPQEE